MYVLWFCLFCGNPVFLLLGFLGFFGEEAERAAGDVAVMYGTFGSLAIVGLAAASIIYFLLKLVGLV